MQGVTPDLRQLRSFVAVAEEGSLTRAARRLHIAQQSLSQQIRTLEAMLGARLFERTSRGVELTEVGAVLLRETRPVLAQAERAFEAVRRAARGEQGEVRIGFLASLANYLMPPVVRAFAERHPALALQAQELSVASLVSGLRNGTLDAGLSRPPLVHDLEAEVVLTEPVAIALPEDHPLAGRETLSLSELADQPWVFTPARVLAALAPPLRRGFRAGGLPAVGGAARDEPAESPRAGRRRRGHRPPPAVGAKPARHGRRLGAARRRGGSRGAPLAP
jgi:DNA-binding transcriptional LysR family regulator